VRNSHWIIAFFVALAAHLVAIVIENQLIEQVTKPLLLINLGCYFISETKKDSGSLRIFIILALLLSWIGDVLLIFQSQDEMFFIAGLCAFLLAHVFYIIFFHKIRMRENIRSNAWFLLIIVVYYAALMNFLSPYLGDMKLPVRIYGIVISFMFLLALHMVYLKDKITGRYLLGGAALFVISDTLLALNKFWQPIEFAGVLIMLTYGLAQYFLIRGAVRIIR
jgi:uncharacterized membrane protein YhhN